MSISFDTSEMNSSQSKNDKDSSMVISQDEDDDDESLVERIIALSEMFPESVRNGTYSFVNNSWCFVKMLYSFSCSIAWLAFSSSALLFAPVIFEVERAQTEEMQRQQHRQILLGPNAALSGHSSHLIPMMPLPSK